MMTIDEFEKKLTELEDLHNELKAQIAELKAQGEEKPKPPHPRPYPVDGQNYFSFNCMGGVYESEWCSDQYDLDARESGNVFFGKTAAEFAAERMKVLAEMREWAGNWDDGVALKYDGTKKLISAIFISPRQYTFGDMRFATKEDAEGCIKAVGKERLLRYYFMVPEEDDDGID
jgi:hypothetical protein